MIRASNFGSRLCIWHLALGAKTKLIPASNQTMKLTYCSLILLSLFVLPPLAFSQYQTDIDDGMFVLVQTTVRNSDGVLTSYLESSKFTTINIPALQSLLDLEASRGSAPIISIDGQPYQVIRRAQEQTFAANDVIASTNLHDNVEGKRVHIARFSHDGYPVSPGDTMQSIWTFVRAV